MNKKYLVSMVFLAFFSACSENEEVKSIDIKEVEKEKTTPIVKKEADILEQLGFDVQGEKIIIDMNKTSHFFEMLEVQMNNKAKEIEKKIEQADINMTEGMGVIVEGDTIGIDLNKTRNMMQQINVLMKDIFLDVNRTNH